MTSNAVDVTAVAGSIASTDLSTIGLIMQADIVVKIVMIALFLASIWCWAIIFDKWKNFRNTRYRTDRFEKAYRSSQVFGPLYQRLKSRQDNPMAAMFVAGMNELTNGVLKGISKPTPEQKENSKDRIYYSVQRIKNSSIDKMQKDLIFLATIGSASPFIGLFGTVWGIVNSFQAIALSKNTTLAVVAPGIAEALLATGIGLFAAIPAVIFYNVFSNEIRNVAEKLEEFSGELSTLLTHQVHLGKE